MATVVESVEAFLKGDPGTVADVGTWARQLRKEKRFELIAPLLVEGGQRALYRDDGEWERERWEELAVVMRDHQQFGYGRRLLGRLRRVNGEDSEWRRQQHAFCTYKDVELPAARRLDRALEILTEGGPLEQSRDGETLGIAGAIYKRRWAVEVKRADLESARWCYERGYAVEEGSEPKVSRRGYNGVNAAFVCDLLAVLEEEGLGDSGEVGKLRARAREIREQVVGEPQEGDWGEEILGEALFGLDRFDEAEAHLRRVGEGDREAWRLETTAMQLAELGHLRAVETERLAAALRALLGEPGGVLERSDGKVGLALSGGGFRASLFHIGVLARLAECGVLRRIEVLSCVSGGSILGAYYYLKLRRLLQEKPDGQITDADYVELVRELADEFLAGVQEDLRGQLFTNPVDDWRMIVTARSRTDRAAELLEEIFYSKVPKDPGKEGPWRMTDLFVKPAGSDGGFSLRYGNWLRRAKVPVLVLNATTLNTGHSWQFTASWMGEAPNEGKERVDASSQLRRVYYPHAPEHLQEPPLALAVAASASVPGLFPPVTLTGLYDKDSSNEASTVELSDGGVHDNQGIASLLEQDCAVALVSDASGQAPDDEDPARDVLGVIKRANSILMARVRGAQFEDLSYRRRSGLLRGLMIVHLKKGLPAPPRDWTGCQEPYRSEDDAFAPLGTDEDGPYGIDEKLQRALAEMRTDLDFFSDDEAYALMAAGYRMTRHELVNALPDLAAANPDLERLVEWPFAGALEQLGEGKTLTEHLRIGHERFFRRWRSWRARRRRGKGPAGASRALARVGRLAFTPVRAVVAAPLALGGAGLARVYRRFERGGKGSG